MGGMSGGFGYVEEAAYELRSLKREKELLLQRNAELAAELDKVEKDKKLAKKLYNG